MLFEIDVRAGEVSVHSDDPQNNHRILDRWESRFQAWAKRQGT